MTGAPDIRATRPRTTAPWETRMTRSTSLALTAGAVGAGLLLAA